MKSKQLLKLTAIMLFMAGAFACTKDEKDPQHSILGKWELVAKGINENELQQVVSDGSYIEFLPDGKMIEYFSETDEYLEETYYIDSEYLVRNDNIFCHYAFDKNKLKLSDIKGAEYVLNLNMFIYQRLK